MSPQVTAFLAALAETEYLPPERMAAYQRRLIEKLVRHARSETAFYAGRLAPLFGAGDTIDWDRWPEIPIVRRADAQENVAAMVARSLPPAAGNAVEDTSSGSTGRPLRHFTADIQNVASACCSERFFRWHGLKPEALTARIRAARSPETAYPHGRPATGWRIGHPDSRMIDLSIVTTPSEQIEWLDRVRPDYLFSYPSNLRELARVAEAAGRRLDFDAVGTFGEMVTEDLRVSIRDHFGRDPLDRYGASEVGHISAMCPLLRQHIAAEVVLVELLDDDNAPVAPGVPGRVVVTPFYNFAMPLIRYDLGDYAILAVDPCPCGRALPVFARILGRTRNVFRFSDGTSVWPILYSGDMQRLVPNQQFQVVQKSYTEVEFRYVPMAPDQVNDLAGLDAYFKRRLHPTIGATAVAVSGIPRSAGGKFEDYVCLIEPGNA